MLVYHFEGVPRSPLSVALKNVLTLGIHTKVWLYRINREMDGHEGFHIDLRWLGVMVALPVITPIIVKFQTARRLNMMVSHQVTLPLVRASRLGWISLVPVIGAGFYAYWVQHSLNKHWFWHRRQERIRLARERIKRIATEADSEESLGKRMELENEVRILTSQIEEEVEAARIRWGDERFEDRKKRADLAAQRGRLTRTELAKLRAEEKEHRKAEKQRRKAERKAKLGMGDLSALPDPEDDAAWQPKTELPERAPDEIRSSAEREARELTEEEAAELKAAESALAKRQKEEKQLEKARARVRKQKAKLQAAEEKAADKKHMAEERKRVKEEAKAEKAAAKAEKAKEKGKETPAKGEKKPKKEKRSKKDKHDTKEADKAPEPAAEAAEPKGIPVMPRKVRAAPQIHATGDGPLRELTVTCPRCQTKIEGIRKRGDKPAKLECPACHLVGKV